MKAIYYNDMRFILFLLLCDCNLGIRKQMEIDFSWSFITKLFAFLGFLGTNQDGFLQNHKLDFRNLNM
uniref:Uncharacterized protein n=1 Tax=Rhizophora mucronata TaxID=61149 RepID=A0A2P2NYJ2_RHIMU